MYPPPPILPAPGCVTASANAVATAAATAFPPARRSEAPVSAAMAESDTTRPVVDGTPMSGAVRDVGALTARAAMAASERALRGLIILIILTMDASGRIPRPLLGMAMMIY